MVAAPAAPDAAARPWHGVDHYENFPVASWLVPRRQRPAVQALYRFARYADDVADEGEVGPAERLAELDALQRALLDLARPHPAVQALLPHLAGLPGALDDCQALLSAFRQDVTVHRHPDFAHLRDYCSRSADPVGRLMLALFGCRHEALLPASDAICTGLQLLNFVQDVAIDVARGRLYIPLDELSAAALTPADLDRACREGRAGPALRRLLAAQTDRAAALLESGAPLARQVPWRLGLELRAVLGGARRVIALLRAGDHDPFLERPRLRRRDALAVLGHALRAVPATA